MDKPQRPISVLSRFALFGVVGAIAFAVDAIVLYIAIGFGSGLYFGRIISYFAAATFTWVLNRRYTFRTETAASFGEWLRYIGANAIGGGINFGTYSIMVAKWSWAADHPVVAVAAGSIAGLVLNFGLSHTLVFRRRPEGDS